MTGTSVFPSGEIIIVARYRPLVQNWGGLQPHETPTCKLSVLVQAYQHLTRLFRRPNRPTHLLQSITVPAQKHFSIDDPSGFSARTFQPRTSPTFRSLSQNDLAALVLVYLHHFHISNVLN